MKRFLLLPVGLVSGLAVAGCGSSGATGGGGDASTQTDTGAGDATVNGDDTGTGEDTGTGTGDGAAQVCGDGIVAGTEQCDDGTKNGTAGDPCTTSCTWVCIAGDPVKGNAACNVGLGNACVGPATCQANHTCLAGAAATDGTVCAGSSSADGGISDGGSTQICKAGTCITDYCGDGLVVPGDGKDCDFGTGNGAGTGCEINCKFSCTTGADAGTPCPQSVDVCAGTSACTPVTVSGAAGQKCVSTPLANDAGCDGTGHCNGGTCSGGTCGNGVVDTGEQCDWGTANNVAGLGCNPDCTFSCQTTPSDSCATNSGCEANPTTCQTVADPLADAGTNSNPGQKCQSTTQIASCAPCNTAGGDFVCVNQVCAASHCGDACLDKRDLVNGRSEQCDDGNLLNLDGCDSSCQFEQDERATTVAIATTTPTFCPSNVLANADGGALTGTALGILGPELQAAVNDGTSTIAFKFMGITDLSGQNQDAGLTLGALTGTPAAAPSGRTYDGGADEDWWYTTAGSTINTSRNPTSLLPASFTGGVLNGAGSFSLTLSLAGANVQLNLVNAKLQAQIGASNTPLTSTGSPPGHLASEHLDPTLTSFDKMTGGQVCGDVTANSFASAPVPTSLLPGGGLAACSEKYSGNLSENTLLDVIVNGCKVLGGIATAINPTQPDTYNQATPVGNGGPYHLVLTGTHVTACQDTGAAHTYTSASDPTDFTACLQAATYSAYFNFTSDRVIMK